MSNGPPDKFDRVLKRMLELKPLTKEEISARIQEERQAKKAAFQGYLKRKGKLKGK
jgi:hypothetical protein